MTKQGGFATADSPFVRDSSADDAVVNALGGFGRWHFEEFRDWAMMEEDFAALVDRLLKKENA